MCLAFSFVAGEPTGDLWVPGLSIHPSSSYFTSFGDDDISVV